MARPQRSTKDAWLDTFADWDSGTQEAMIDTCELLHRQTKRAEAKRKPQPAATAAEQQPSLTGLPDEDQQ